MAQLWLHATLLLLRWLPAACHSYQTQPTFLTFSQLAALEGKSPVGSEATGPPSSADRSLQVTSVLVTCLKDSMQVEVVVEQVYGFGLGFPLDPQHLSLGPLGQSQSGCRAVGDGGGAYTFRSLHGACGTELSLTDDDVVFSTQLVYAPPPAGQLPPHSFVAIPVQCHYKRRYALSSSALKPSLVPVASRLAPQTLFRRRRKMGWMRKRSPEVPRAATRGQ